MNDNEDAEGRGVRRGPSHRRYDRQRIRGAVILVTWRDYLSIIILVVMGLLVGATAGSQVAHYEDRQRSCVVGP